MRWLHLSAAVAPLLGLLGTVWGMIRAFYDTTQLAPGQNKAEYLAEGIYIALVTTLAGLIVAIPAALAAHYFEGKLLRLIRRLEEFAFCLAPAISRVERTAGAAPAASPEAGPRRTRTAGVPTVSP
jgi:biopolymer transport protein ExbB